MKEIFFGKLDHSPYNRNDVELKAENSECVRYRIFFLPMLIILYESNFSDEIEVIREIDPVSGDTLQTFENYQYIQQIRCNHQG